MADENVVRVDVEGTTATVLLNRPEALNAINLEAWAGLRGAAQTIRENHEIRAVILTGAGDRAFTAGVDVKSGQHPTEAFPSYRSGYDRMDGLRSIVSAFEDLAVPVIAAVNGYCLGMGL